MSVFYRCRIKQINQNKIIPTYSILINNVITALYQCYMNDDMITHKTIIWVHLIGVKACD